MLSRRTATVGALVLGALTLLTASLTWVTGSSSDAVRAHLRLAVTGTAAAPGVSAAAFVVVAAALALALAGRIGRLLAVIILAAAGITTGASALGAITSPQRIALAAAAERTGLPSLDGSASLTAGPYLAVAFGALTVLWAIWAGVSARRWQASSRRHDPGAAAEVVEDDPFSSWDALSRGEDPT
jgi:hypothetical protein